MKQQDDAKPAAPADWDAIRQRLQVTQDALRNDFTPSPEQCAQILRERALALAVETPAAAEAGAEVEVLEFVLAQEHYAFETAWIREVYPLKELTPLPCTPRFVLGIINIRGRIMSVIDIKRFFDLPERGLTDLDKAIILQDGAMEFGILADQIVGTRWLPVAQIQPPLPTLTGIRSEYLKGVTAQRLILLDAGRLLTARALVVDEEVHS